MIEPVTTYKIAHTAADFNEGTGLFIEYARSLNIDLSFQDFENELKTMAVQYNSPAGGLLLAQVNGQAVGCAGVRDLDKETAELKRMYVQSGYRGLGIGVGLLVRSLDLAKELHYKKIRLDTLANMTRAQALYQSFGFYSIPAYRPNPIEGVLYMEKIL